MVIRILFIVRKFIFKYVATVCMWQGQLEYAKRKKLLFIWHQITIIGINSEYKSPPPQLLML